MADQVRVFVSHHHSEEEDKFTARLVADLEAAGADVWVDTGQVSSGNFVQKISEGMEGRQWLVLVMTSQSVASPWVMNEVNAALSEHTAGRMLGVIPFVMTRTPEQDIPVLWRQLHRYNATHNYPEALAGLLRALGLAFDAPTTDAIGTRATLPRLSSGAAPKSETEAAPEETPRHREYIATLPDTEAPESLPKNALQNTRKRGQDFGVIGTLGAAMLIAVIVIAVAVYGSGGFQLLSPTPTSTSTLTHIHSSLPTKFNPIPFSDKTFSQATGWPMSSYCFTYDSVYGPDDTANDNTGVVCYVPAQGTSDATIVSNIRSGTYDYGYVLRALDDTHYYLFVISANNSWAFDKIDGLGAPYTIAHGSSSKLTFSPGAYPNTKVQMTGAHFEFFIGNTLLGTADDASYSSGMIGLYAGPNGAAGCTYVAIT